MNTRIAALIVILAVSSVYTLGASDDCSRTAATSVYSNAFADKETGDVLGYELAIKRHDDSTVEAFFYIYEGAPSNEAIPLPGRISDGNLSIQGDWVEHLIEYPSKKETVQTHTVEISGVLNPASFRGEVTIAGLAKKEPVRLKRVNNIWLCRE
jgi:hypothetical protein